jgi:hypothetical protein
MRPSPGTRFEPERSARTCAVAALTFIVGLTACGGVGLANAWRLVEELLAEDPKLQLQ